MPILIISRLTFFRRLFITILFVAMSFVSTAHPMPNSAVLLSVQSKGVAVELQLPLSELYLAFGNDVNKNMETLIERLGPQLRAYIIEHVRPVSGDNHAWTVSVLDFVVQPVEQNASGPYRELIVHLWMQPPAGAGTRDFTFYYDVIIHQLVTHSALVSVRQDWEAGIYAEQPVEVGVIALDIVNNVIPPIQINLEEGGMWKGFKSMVSLGTHHIAEGTDHLLFLLVLLLAAPLIAESGKWSGFGGLRYGFVNLLKVVTAFTLGHSVTLLAGALGWFHLPSQLVEILIAFSILISAIHVLRPIFPRREMYVAAGFGLIHGLAFADTLANLNLDAGQMALSILGFNIGIELMQLFVIALIVPWLILLSRSEVYRVVRIGGAVLSGIAALAWMTERILNQANPVTKALEELIQYAPWMIGLLALTAILNSYLYRMKTENQK